MVYLEVAVVCAERRTDEWDCVSICTFLFTPPLFLQIKPSQDPGFHAPFSGPTQRPDSRPLAGGGTRHVISLARRLLGAGLMDCGPSARTGSVGYSRPPWSLRSSSSAWSLWERRKPLLLLASLVYLFGSVSGNQPAAVWVFRLSFVSRCLRPC